MDEMMANDSFLVGDIVYLRKPDIQRDVLEGEWHAWFNDQEITKYLIHGVFPISRQDEAKYVEDQVNNKSTLLLSIIQKETHKHIGIISLKSIDLINRTAEIGIVMGSYKVAGAALEAMYLLTSHAFERLNLIRLSAGQHEKLWKWINLLELIGYRIEGYRKQAGLRGETYDIVLTGITADDYYRFKNEKRNPVSFSPENLSKNRRPENLTLIVRDFLERLYKD